MTTLRRKFLPVLASIWLALTSEAATFLVVNENDSGAGSFRQALLDANAASGAHVIQFNIPGAGIHTLAPLTQLPDITNSVTISGFSQPGSSPNTLANGNNAVQQIRLDGANVTNNAFAAGLKFNGANNNVVRGLLIVRFYTAIQLNNSSGNTIAGNSIGVDFDNVSRGGNGTGVDVTCFVFSRSTGNTIGGFSPADRNVISGYHTGISFTPAPADHNTVIGNFIGTDSSGTLPRGNLFEGIFVSGATNIIIGGAVAGARNVVAANGTGIFLQSSSGDVVQGNYIGTDVTGHYGLGTSGKAIALQSCSSVTIGGSGAGNLIGNSTGVAGYGIFLQGCVNSTVVGNWIGTDNTGTYAFGNSQDGIYLVSSTNNVIGGTASGAANVIRFNAGAGVNLSTGETNLISANSIYDNGRLGIDLGNDGPSPNDPGDNDGGANQLQNYPVISSVTNVYGTFQIQGTLASKANAIYTLEFFASPAWDPNGVAEGQTFLGASFVPTDGSGNASFSAALRSAGAPPDSIITATATDSFHNTSEFSVGYASTVGPQTVSLAIARQGANALITWPSSASAFQLETTTSLSPPVQWQPASGTISDNGTVKSFTVTNAPGSSSRFYRLKGN